MTRFDDDEIKGLSTAGLNHLRHCDQKLSAARCMVTTPEMVMSNTTVAGFKGVEFTQEQSDREIKRLTAARKNIVEGLSKEELAEYKVWQKANSTKEMSDEERAAMLKRLAENKDKPSH